MKDGNGDNGAPGNGSNGKEPNGKLQQVVDALRFLLKPVEDILVNFTRVFTNKNLQWYALFHSFALCVGVAIGFIFIRFLPFVGEYVTPIFEALLGFASGKKEIAEILQYIVLPWLGYSIANTASRSAIARVTGYSYGELKYRFSEKYIREHIIPVTNEYKDQLPCLKGNFELNGNTELAAVYKFLTFLRTSYIRRHESDMPKEESNELKKILKGLSHPNRIKDALLKIDLLVSSSLKGNCSIPSLQEPLRDHITAVTASAADNDDDQELLRKFNNLRITEDPGKLRGAVIDRLQKQPPSFLDQHLRAVVVPMYTTRLERLSDGSLYSSHSTASIGDAADDAEQSVPKNGRERRDSSDNSDKSQPPPHRKSSIMSDMIELDVSADEQPPTPSATPVPAVPATKHVPT